MDYGQCQSLSHFGNSSASLLQAHHQALDSHPQQQQQHQAQEQAQEQAIQQLPQLGQVQLQQLQQQFALEQHQLQTPSSGFGTSPSPWDSPSDMVTFDFAGAQLAATLDAVGSTATMAYHHSPQDGLLPPIATLDVPEARMRSDVPALTPSSAVSSLTPTSTTAESPLAVRSEVTPQDTQPIVQCQSQARVQPEPQAERQDTQYQTPQVIQLVGRPQRKLRQQVRAGQQSNRTRAQARSKNQKEKQSECVLKAQEQSSSSSTSKSTGEPDQREDAQAAGSNPPALQINVPSSALWYGIHALAPSQQRLSPSTLLSKNVNGRVSARSQRQLARDSTHPYPQHLRQMRSFSGPAVLNGTSTQQQRGNMNVQNNAPSPSHSLPTPSPAPTSPSITSPPSVPQVMTTSTRPPFPRYLVRTDVHCDVQTNTLTAMLEIPGVPRAGVRVALGDLDGNRILIVRGKLRRVAFPPIGGSKGKDVATEDRVQNDDAGYVVKERKVGDFKRILVVPPETKAEDIRVSMADGILFLRYPAGEQPVALTQTVESSATDDHGSTDTANSSASSQSMAQFVIQTMQAQVASSSSMPVPPTSCQCAQTRADPGGRQFSFRVQTPATSSKNDETT